MVFLELMKTIFVTQCFSVFSFNAFVTSSPYPTTFYCVRLVLLPILSKTLSSELVFYFILVQQTANTIHKIVYQDYYRPES